MASTSTGSSMVTSPYGGSTSTGTIRVTTGSTYTGTGTVTEVDVTKTKNTLGDSLASPDLITNLDASKFQSEEANMSEWSGLKQIIRVGKYLFLLGNNISTYQGKDNISKSSLQVFDITTKMFVTSQFFADSFFTNSIANNTLVSRIERLDNADGTVSIIAISVSPITICKFTLNADGTLKTKDKYKTMTENTTYHSFNVIAANVNTKYIMFTVGSPNTQQYCTWLIRDAAGSFDTALCRTDLGEIIDIKTSIDYTIFALSSNALRIFTISEFAFSSNVLRIFKISEASLVLKSTTNITSTGSCTGMDMGISANMLAVAITKAVNDTEVAFVNCENLGAPFIRNRIALAPARGNTGAVKNIANMFLLVGNTKNSWVSVIRISALSTAVEIRIISDSSESVGGSNSILTKNLCVYENKIYFGVNTVKSWNMYENAAVFGTSITIGAMPLNSKCKLSSHDITGKVAGLQYTWDVLPTTSTIHPITTPDDISNFLFDVAPGYVGQSHTLYLKIIDVNGSSKIFTSSGVIVAPERAIAVITNVLCDTGNIANGASLIAGDISFIDVCFSSVLSGVGTKVALVSGANTVFITKVSTTDNKILRIELPNRLNYGSTYQLIIPKESNGGPSFADYVPSIANDYVLNFTTQPAESFNQSSTIDLVGLTPINSKYEVSTKEVTVMIDTVVALQNTNCVLNINIKTSDSTIYESKAVVDLNTNGNFTINSGSDYIRNININGRYISFVMVAQDTWNGTDIGAKVSLCKKENTNDKIERIFTITYNTGTPFDGIPKIGFADNTEWFFDKEDIAIQISTPGVVIKNVKINSILLDGASGAFKAWSGVANDPNAFQVILDATKIDYAKAYKISFLSGSVVDSTNSLMNLLELNFTTPTEADASRPKIKPKLYGVTAAGVKLNVEPENNYTEVLTAKNAVLLNVTQTNGTDVTQFSYTVGAGVFSEWADITLNEDTEVFVSKSGEFKIKCRDAEGNESLVMSCFFKIVTSVQYTVDVPNDLYTISAKKCYKPNDLFKYVDNQYDKDGKENCINDTAMVIECPVKYITHLKYSFNTTDSTLANVAYAAIETFENIGNDITKIVINYSPTERVNNIRFKMKDQLGNETPVIQRIFNFDNEAPKVISFNLYNAASDLLENSSTNNPEIIVKVKATDDSLPVTVYISEDGGETVSEPYKLNDGILNILSYTLNDQSNGAKNISLVAVDSAKNTSIQILTKSFAFNKKTIWGTLSIEKAAQLTNKKIVSAVISSNAAVRFKLSRSKEELSSGSIEYKDFSGSVTIDEIDISDVTEGGVAKLYALISDSSGNTSIIEDSITVKRTLAQQSFTIVEGTKVKSKTITLNFQTTDDIVFYKICNNGKWDSDYTAMPDTKTTTIELTEGDGNKIISAMFKDSIGNITGEIKNTIMLDTTPPRVKLTSKSGYYVTNDVTFDIIVNQLFDDSKDAATDIKFSLNGGEYSQSWQPLKPDVENLFTIPFDPAQAKEFKVNAKVRDAVGNISTEEMTLIFTYDDTPLNVTIGIEKTDLPKKDNLKLLFNKELDSSTVTMDTVKIQRLYTENPEVAYMPFVASNKKVMVINATFEYYTMYKLTITANVADIAGNFLEKEYSVIFQTEVDPILTIVSTSIDGEPTNIAADSEFSITFGWSMNFSTTNSSNITITSDYNGELIPCIVKRGINNYQVKVVPEEELENGVTYTLSINDNVTNEKGSSFEPGTVKSYKFKTEYIEPLVLFQNTSKNYLTFKEGKFIKLSETSLTQNLAKKYGISIRQLSNIPQASIQTLEEETKIIILASEKYTTASCMAVKQKTADVEYTMDTIEPNLVHDNFYWSVMNEDEEVAYTIKDNRTIVFAVPKTNSDGESTVNEDLKVLCKVKK